MIDVLIRSVVRREEKGCGLFASSLLGRGERGKEGLKEWCCLSPMRFELAMRLVATSLMVL